MSTATQYFDFSNLTKDGAIELAKLLGLKRDWARAKLTEIKQMLRVFDTEKLLDAARRATEDQGEVFDAADFLTDEKPADQAEQVEQPEQAARPATADDATEWPFEVKAATAPSIYKEDDPRRAPLAPTRAEQPAAKPADVNHVANLLAQLLATGAVNQEQVESIVEDRMGALARNIGETVGKDVRRIVDEALAGMPARELVITIGDKAAKRVEGYTRPEFEKVLRRAAAGVNQLLVGPAGCGKTHLAAQVAKALDVEFASVSCSAGMSESALFGWLLPIGESGRFEYVSSDFVRVYEGGGVFLLDEIDAADENVLLAINQAIANGQFHLPQRHGNTLVKRHDAFVCIAAANTYGKGGNAMYAGRNQLDEATIDRFRAGTMALDYDAQLEAQAVDKQLLTWAKTVRDRIERNSMRRILSTRFLLDGTRLMAAGESLDQIKATFFLGWKADEVSKVST